VTGGTVLFSSGIQAPDAEHDMSSRAADSRLSQEDVASTRLSSEMGSYNAVDGVREGVYPDVNDRANFETKAADARLSRQIDLLALSIEERAREGIFLGFQYPVEIPGVSMANFMKAAVAERRKHLGLEPLSAAAFLKTMREKAALVELDPAMISRAVNEGFSGGEKKKNEIFQMAMLEPRLAVLDETDSGLDIDALRIVGEGVSKLRRPDNAIVLITHYQRLLDYIVPDFVHVLYKGRIIISGDRDLALKLEKEGYDWLISKS
jgi:Fe-S cluster assembly ATP-binding protein